MLEAKEKKFDTMPVEAKVKEICAVLREYKANEIKALDVRGVSGFAEGVIIATANSMRQGQALADHVLDFCKKTNKEFLSMEGYQTGTWILLDLNDVLVNVFQADTRSLYNLEGLWGSAKAFDIATESKATEKVGA